MHSFHIFLAFCAVVAARLIPTTKAQTTYQLSDKVSNLVAAGTTSWDNVCPSGSEHITDQQECLEYATSELGKSGLDMISNVASAPPGCFYFPPEGFEPYKATFNNNLDVLPGSVEDYAEGASIVCKSLPVTAGAGGDPHVEMYHQETITYQGICDVLFLHSPDGADGLDLAIHARLTSPKRQKTGGEYTFISEIVVSIGGNIYEVQSKDAAMFLNGVLHHNHTKEAEDDSTSVMTIALPTAAPETSYTLTKKVMGEKRNRVLYTFRFANGSEIELRANIHFFACFIEVRGDFGGTQVKGLLGNPQVPGMFGRDGRLMPTDNVNEYGQEWQVLDTEPHLFVDAHRYPQYPEQCIVVDLEKDFNTADNRRKLTEVENDGMEQNAPVSELEAKEACRNNKLLEYCIHDVLAFDNLETAEDPFYQK